MASRKRRIWSIKEELIKKSREAALSAVQIFNNPNILFKSETYIVLMVVAWTYLLHAYYRKEKIEYRYFSQKGKRKNFDYTKHGAYKHWELERCINCKESPIDKDTSNNIKFMIGLRHEIEHQMTTRIDDLLSAKFQACCLNYNHYIKQLFDDKFGIDKHLSFSLQFSAISEEQKNLIDEREGLPKNIESFIREYDAKLSEEEYSSQSYAYRILFVPKIANRKGQADAVIEFVKPDTHIAGEINRVLIKETEKNKFLPGDIVKKMKNKGFTHFSMHYHTLLWKALDAKNPSKGLGCQVAGTWYWYEKWIDIVLKHCEESGTRYK